MNTLNTQNTPFLENRIKELEAEVVVLKRKLANANKQLKSYRDYDNRHQRYDADYLPYEDDDRRGE